MGDKIFVGVQHYSVAILYRLNESNTDPGMHPCKLYIIKDGIMGLILVLHK